MFTNLAHPPQVILADLAATSKLVAGSRLRLTWSVAEDTQLSHQQLFISKDSGITFQLLAQLPAEAREASWSVSDTAGLSQIRFRLTAFDSVGNSGSDETSYDFRTLAAGSVSFVFVLSKSPRAKGWLELKSFELAGQPEH